MTWFAPDTPPLPLLRKLFPDLPAQTDFWQRVRWFAPGVMKLTAATGAAGGAEDDGMVNTNAHIVTPKTARPKTVPCWPKCRIGWVMPSSGRSDPNCFRSIQLLLP